MREELLCSRSLSARSLLIQAPVDIRIRLTRTRLKSTKKCSNTLKGVLRGGLEVDPEEEAAEASEAAQEEPQGVSEAASEVQEVSEVE